jgi:hypothetical protein
MHREEQWGKPPSAVRTSSGNVQLQMLLVGSILNVHSVASDIKLQYVLAKLESVVSLSLKHCLRCEPLFEVLPLKQYLFEVLNWSKPPFEVLSLE